MAQLSDDAFAFGSALTTLDEAVAGFAARLTPVPETEVVSLHEAEGRVLAAEVRGAIPIPSFDNSAVDGYAVRHTDLAAAGETRLSVVDRVIAGAIARVEATPGTAIRVFTGAPMPPGTDTVYMQEDVRRDSDIVVLPPGLSRGANARFAGEDLAAGAVALAAGRRLRPEDLALAAAVGVADVTVRRRLTVAVLSTGNELVPPGAPLPPAGLYDANRPMLLALARRAGAVVIDGGILRDDAAATAEALARLAAQADVIVTSGGVSTGEEDHVKTAVEQAGQLSFWRIGIKPGRPVAMGVLPVRAGTSAAFLGLPGNPVAAYVTFTQVVRPLIAALAGEDWRRPKPLPVCAGFAYRKKTGRREFVRVRLEQGYGGMPIARKHPQDGAGVITSLTVSDGLIELPEDVTRVTEGDVVGYLPFGLVDQA
jgi:molybdopterin molybdotransferase